MRKIILSFAAVALVMASCKKAEDKAADTTTVTDTTAVTEETAEAAPEMDSAAQQKAWEEYMTPGETHKMMATDVGTWKCEAKMWMDPSAPPEVSQMTAEVKMKYGGRFQESTYKGMVMGMPFEGTATMAYDNAAKKIVSTWYDNMSTGIMVLTGDYNPSTKTVEIAGESMDPMTRKMKKTRETFTIVDQDTRKMEMFDNHSGKEVKTMEIMMTRVK